MSEKDRRQIHDELRQWLSDEAADKLMARLPEQDWTDVVRQRDMDLLRAELHADMAGLRVELLDEMRKLSHRMDRLEARVDGLETKIDGAEARVGARIDRVEARIDSLDARIDSLDARIDKLDARIGGLMPRLLLAQFAGSLVAVGAVLGGIRLLG